MAEKLSAIEHLKSILVLPFTVLVVIPIILIYFNIDFSFIEFNRINTTLRFMIGIVMSIGGLSLFLQSINLFIKIGKGSLAPWQATKKLVIKSLYRYVRNPMILGVFLLLLAESLFFQSNSILIWSLIFIIINHMYFVFREEPDLVKRFGEEYLEYKRNVPRWLPRFTPWRPEEI